MEYRPFSAKFRLSRIPYYLQSFILLFLLIKSQFRFKLLKDLFIFKVTKTVYLKNGLVFRLKSLLDILTLKEVVIDDEYQCRGVRVDDKDKIIIDVGAGFGDFSIMTAKKFPEAKIYAFEPDPDYFSLLQENIISNNICNIIPLDKSINSLVQLIRFVPAGRYDFLKMDCEGCEFNIINKKEIPYLKKMNKLVMEYHEGKDGEVDRLKSVFEDAGFKVKVFPQKQVKNIGLLTAIKI